MRVLVAIDGSPAAEVACELVRSLPWPDGSVIHVVGVVEAPEAGAILPGRHAAPPAIGDDLRSVLCDAVQSIDRDTLAVRRTVFVGRPASVIVAAAEELQAELIVVGSRGRGPVTTMLLGSVSAEVVDHAPCPVLVVRGARATSLLLAVDGSHSARAATTYLAGMKAFAGIPVEVISVAPAAERSTALALTALSEVALAEAEYRHRDDCLHAEAVAACAAEQLGAAGHPVRWSISEGDPAHQIIEAAAAFGTSIVVLGSRGHTGLTRLLLGSVARNVLLHTPASVLIVREPVRAIAPEAVHQVHQALAGTSA